MRHTSEEQEYMTFITSEHRLLDLHIGETLHYKDLILLFVKRDFISKYKQTLLGPAWALIQPLLSAAVHALVFGGLAGLTTADTPGNYVLPGFLFYFAGSVCWTYFAGTLQTVSATFLTNAGVMGKVYYPRIVAPIASALSHLISFAIQFALLALLCTFYLIRGGTSLSVSPKLLLLPLTVLQMMLLGIGLGTIVSSVTTKYRDLQMLVSFGLQLWQYASPITYGLTLVSAGRWKSLMGIYLLNPMTPVVTTFRYALFGFGYFNLTYYLCGWGITILVFFLGLVMFSKIERTFMDTI